MASSKNDGISKKEKSVDELSNGVVVGVEVGMALKVGIMATLSLPFLKPGGTIFHVASDEV